MRRFTLLLVAVLLMVAGRAEAQNNIEWGRFTGSYQTAANGTANGWKPQTPTTAITPGTCLRVIFDENDATTEETTFVFVGGQRVTFAFEADKLAAGSTADVDLMVCTDTDGDKDGTADLTACEELNLRDTNADGIPDSNRFDGDSVGQRGTLDPISVAGFIYLTLGSAAPAAGEEFEVVMCSVP